MKNREMMVFRELGLIPLYRRRGEGAAQTDALPEDLVQNSPDMPALDGPPIEAVPSSQPAFPVSPPDSDRREIILRMNWPELKTAVVSCTACGLHTGRTQTVFGVGDEQASWLFVGEGPGAEEDRLGEPFVGQAGKLLDNMLGAIDLKRGEDVYIANVVKCRPPGNRNPQLDEAQCCEPYLTRQVQLIKPKLLVALGKVAAQNLLNSDAAVGSMRGRLHEYKGIPLIVTYHPAYLLRNPADKARAWEDLCFARATMANLKSAVSAP